MLYKGRCSMKKTNISYFFVLWSSLCSVMYLSKIVVSPVYFIGSALVVIYMLFIFSGRKVQDFRVVKAPLFFLVCVLGIFTYYSNPAAVINIALGLALFVIIVSEGRRLSEDELNRILVTYVKFTITVVTVDSIWRILHPGLPVGSTYDISLYKDTDKWFYLYKYHSQMFLDSNTVALILIPLIMLQWQMKKNGVYWHPVLFLVSVINLISCLSRTAIISIVVAAFIVNIRKSTLTFLLPIIGIASIFLFQGVLSKDPSVITRLHVLDAVGEFISSANLTELMFGVGLGNSTTALGFTPHILFVEYFTGGGIVGFVCFLLFLMYFFFSLNEFASKILIITLLTSFSYYMYAGSPFLFVPIALSYLMGGNLSE